MRPLRFLYYEAALRPVRFLAKLLYERCFPLRRQRTTSYTKVATLADQHQIADVEGRLWESNPAPCSPRAYIPEFGTRS
jgi:hypothetical protein